MARSTGKPDCEIKRAKKILRRSSLEEKTKRKWNGGQKVGPPFVFQKGSFLLALRVAKHRRNGKTDVDT